MPTAKSKPRISPTPRVSFVAPESATVEAVVAFVGSGADGPRLLPCALPAAVRDSVSAWLKRPGAFKGKEGDAVVLPGPQPSPSRIAVVGVGPVERLAPWRLGGAAAVAARLLSGFGFRSAALPLVAADQEGLHLATELMAEHLVRGAVEGGYRFESLRAERGPAAPAEWVLLSDSAPSNSVRHAAQAGATVGAVLNEVSDLANLPGNIATPVMIAETARRLAQTAGLACRIYDEAALRRARCTALLAVAAGSRQPPRLVVLRYAGTRRTARPIMLIGKTLTFDSGGISLKPPANMEWMRYDKGGGMAVLAAVLAAARLRLPQPVVAMLAAAENMPGGGAMRPGDIIRTRAGKTVEIITTDAEGRLVLADALSLAAEYRPASIVDVATLTGAARIALGVHASAVCSPHDGLRDALVAAGERSGDRLWPLPLWPEYDDMLKTPFADLKNAGDGSAGTIAGAAFLRAFVPEDVPWAHLDIAARAWLEKDQPYRPAGATLAGARVLIEWMKRLNP